MKQQLLNLKNQAVAHISPHLSTAKNLAQKLGAKTRTAFAASYVKHPNLTMLGMRVGIRGATLGIGLLAGALTLEGLLSHDIFSGTASADACQTGYYYETDIGHISDMTYSDGPDGVHGTGDDILQVRGLTNYPIDFRAEDGIPPETLQQYNDGYNAGDYVKIEMCTHKGGIFGGGILSRTHYGISMAHLEEPKPNGSNESIDATACVIGAGVAGLVLFGLFGAPYLIMDRYRARQIEKRNKNRPDILERIEDKGEFEEIKPRQPKNFDDDDCFERLN